jgi:malate dehydrogenase (oxaloacetate-decarboxylating)(NADP+)
MSDDLDAMSLEYHRWPTPGKISVAPTTKLANQRDLSLAYSPGVAAACNEIAKDANAAAEYTTRANLVAVVTNGTAVLGLGAIGPLASKPVMEGKAVLFKKFANIDCFDLELDELDPERFVDIVAALEPTFGGINLEDIKAPECFLIEKACRERMNIPVFHDDQHGTAICVAAAVLNGLRLVNKDISKIKLVASGAGAAALACLNLLMNMGLDPTNVFVTDVDGVLHEGRNVGLNDFNSLWTRHTEHRTLGDVMPEADVFLGLSAGGVLKAEMVKGMSVDPLILALANPNPEIDPAEAKAVRPDAVIATGRSDFPNQVNNVLCFPFLFRGALDVGATVINEEMKIAAVTAIADLAKAESSDVVAKAYRGENLSFGPEYLIPKPFDPRLITSVAPAVAQAAMDSGVATRPIADMETYAEKLTGVVYRTGFAMKPVFDRAREDPRRVVYAEGHAVRVLQAVQIAVDDGLAKPILVGRPDLIEQRIKENGLRLKMGDDVEILDRTYYDKYEEYVDHYHRIMGRRGVSPDRARLLMATRATLISAMMVAMGDADAMICGTVGGLQAHLHHIMDVIGLREGISDVSALELMISDRGAVFMCDTAVTYKPSASQIAEMTILASEQVRRFGMEPKVGLLSHTDFGSSDTKSAKRMRAARQLLREQAPELAVEGEMRADTALDPFLRDQVFQHSELTGPANLLVMPSLDAANIAFNMSRILANGISVGPMLIGMALPAHIVSQTVTVRGLVNMTAIATVDAQSTAQTRFSKDVDVDRCV